jgi:tRNA dimethylallyltransferase
MNKVIVVQGPTASGKTELAISLAQKYNTEIISADSRQFYKEMSIGTAKPSDFELKTVKHHFIDCSSVIEEFTSATYAKLAEPILKKLLELNGFAILVGGSGMFVDALINGLDEVPVDPQIRLELTELVNQNGLEPLLNELAERDPLFYEQVDRNNPMRIIRALEAIRSSGQKISDFQKRIKKTRDFQIIRFSIDWPRDLLYSRINQRVDEMISFGLIQEVESLSKFRHLNALNTVGYKEIVEFLEGHINREKAIELIKQHTRNYAKRQLTWLRRYNDIHYLSPLSEKQVLIQAIEVIEAI